MKTLLVALALLGTQLATASTEKILLSLRQTPVGPGTTTVLIDVKADGLVQRDTYDGTTSSSTVRTLSARQMSRIQEALKLVAGKPLLRPQSGLTCAGVATTQYSYEAVTGENPNGTEITILAKGVGPCGGDDRMEGPDAADLIDILDSMVP